MACIEDGWPASGGETATGPLRARAARIAFAVIVFTVGTFATTRSAQALGSVDVEIAAKGSIASSPIRHPNPGGSSIASYLNSSSSPLVAPNPLGFGLGARGGIAFLGFYGGVQMTYYFGQTNGSSSGLSWSMHSLMYGIEAGYGITPVRVLTIRPQLGIGNVTFDASLDRAGQAALPRASDSYLYFEPGVLGLFFLGRWFVGVDARLLFVPGINADPGLRGSPGEHVWTTAYSLDTQLGIKF